MSDTLATRAEILKLARTLGVEPSELDMLAAAAPQDVRELRFRVAAELFAADRERFERVAALAGKVPTALAATLAQHALGARLAARTAGLLDAGQAGELARRLPPSYLADVAEAIDLREVGHLLRHIHTGQIAAVTRELCRREEWVTMGAFVGHLGDRALDAALDELTAEALLRTGFVMEDKGDVDRVVARIGDAQLRTICAGAAEHELWAEALDLAAHAGPEQRERIVAAIDDLDDDAFAAFARAVARDPVLAAVADEALAAAPARLRARVRGPRRAAARGRARP